MAIFDRVFAFTYIVYRESGCVEVLVKVLSFGTGFNCYLQIFRGGENSKLTSR